MSDRISVIDFLAETKDDVNSPTTSTFTSKMSLCRATIAALEESLDADRSALKKMKNSIKAMFNSGQAHVNNEATFIENLEKLGSGALYNKEPESDIGSAFHKLASFTKELSTLLKNLISSINNILLFPLESLLKGDLKGLKGDMKRPFDKSWKDYDTKVKQVEREKRQLAKDAGMIRSEITGAEIAEEMEKERRMFQLQMCEYLIKANEIKTKKGVDFLQHLVEYYHAQNMFFNDGFKVIDHFRTFAEDLTANLHSLRQAQDEEKRQLVELRNVLKLSVSDGDNNTKSQGNAYSLHQLQGNKALGNEKSGYLMKRSEGLRRAWQKRRCIVTDGFLTIYHNKTNKIPVKLNLLTSQLKLVPEDKKQFDLVSHNRTYRFMAEDEHDAMNWVSVLTNSKEDALNRVFGDAASGKSGSEQNAGLKELTRSIIDEVRRLPGNDHCCDCNATEPTWLSTNMGVLLCIECSGIHRDMGVHVSRIQSLTLDDLGTSELLLARSIGNDMFNNIMEEKLNHDLKPTSSSDMEERKSFIRGKYISRNYVVRTCAGDPDALADELGQAIRTRDVFSLLQLFAENADLCASLPGYKDGETALHAAVSLPIEESSSSVLPLVDFLCQNVGSGLNKKTDVEGNTPLHLCAEYNRTECMKLLLRSKANTDIENSNGETPLAIARRLKHSGCEELLEQANSGKFRPIVHIDIDWNLTFVDDDEFISDDELDDRTNLTSGHVGAVMSPMKAGPPENSRYRPSSFKDRPRADPPSGRNAPPAVPPHQNLNRNRSQSMLPASAQADLYRRTSSQPPPLPAKPDNKARDRTTSSFHPGTEPCKEDHEDNGRSVPEIPPKGEDLPPPTSYDTFLKPLSMRLNPCQSTNTSNDTKLGCHGDDDISSFINPHPVMTLRRMFTTKHDFTSRNMTSYPPTSSVVNQNGAKHSHTSQSSSESLLAPTSLNNSFRASNSNLLDRNNQSAADYLKHATPTACSQAYSTNRLSPLHIHSGYKGKLLRPHSALYPPTTSPVSKSFLGTVTGNRLSSPLDVASPSIVISHHSGEKDEKSRSLPRPTTSGNAPLSTVDVQPPAPLPRSGPSSSRPRRVRAIYDCEADNQDELTFVENEIIVVTGVEDQEWWVGHVEHQPHRVGVFPVSFVHILND